MHAAQDTQRLCWRGLRTLGLQHFVKHVWFVFSRHVPEFEDTVSIGMLWTHSHHLDQICACTVHAARI